MAEQHAVHAGVVPGTRRLCHDHHGQHVAAGDCVDDGVKRLAEQVPRRLERPRRGVRAVLALQQRWERPSSAIAWITDEVLMEACPAAPMCMYNSTARCRSPL